MDPPTQDEDVLWRRAFADSMGLFDSLSYGPLPTCPIHNSHLPRADSMVHSASPPAQDSFAAPLPPVDINEALVPSPTLDFTTPVAQQILLPCPTLVGASPMDELPPLAPHPTPSTALGVVGGLGSPIRARHGGDVPTQVRSEAMSAAQAAALQVSDEEAHQASPGPGKHGYGICFLSLVSAPPCTAQQTNPMDGLVASRNLRHARNKRKKKTKQQKAERAECLASSHRGARDRVGCFFACLYSC